MNQSYSLTEVAEQQGLVISDRICGTGGLLGRLHHLGVHFLPKVKVTQAW